MATSGCVRLLFKDKTVIQLHRTFCVTSLVSSKLPKKNPLLKWGLEPFPNEPRSKIGPLTDLPDFTYCDGRPTPLSKGQLRRKNENYQLAKRIVQLVKEMEFAKSEHAKKKEEETQRQQAILSSKLKQKSDDL